MALNEITVSIAGGYELDRAGLEALISRLPGLRVVPFDNHPPPQVLVWIRGTKSNGPARIAPAAAVLMLTDDAEFDSLPQTLALSHVETVTGLFSRDESPTTLGIAIRQLAHGEQYLSPSLATAILEKRRATDSLTQSEKSSIETLSEREREILDLLAQGLSNKRIASQLYLSVRTVEGHLANIYSQLGVHSRTEAMLIAVKIPKNSRTRGR